MLVQLMRDLDHEFPCPMDWIKVGRLRPQNTEKQSGRGLERKKEEEIELCLQYTCVKLWVKIILSPSLYYFKV